MDCFNLFRIKGLCAAALALLAGVAQADNNWPAAHQNASNNAVVNIPAHVTSLAPAPSYFTGEQDIPYGVSITIGDFHFYAPAHHADGVTTQVTVKCFDAGTGDLVWESLPLDEGVSRAFMSATSVSVDSADNAVYYATGNTIYKWNALTGAPVWSREIDGTNTTTSPTVQRWDIVNSSITLGGGRLFFETYGGFQPQWKQIVALDAATGTVEWFHNDEGAGTGTPVYIEAGVNSRVYTAGETAVRCYDAATGVLDWDSAVTPLVPWDSGSWALFGSLTEKDGLLYVGTGDPAFLATTTTLICADAATGELVWEQPGLNTDVPPLVLNGKVYLYGGSFPGHLASFDALTGAPGFNQVVASSNSIFRDYMAATQDRIYLAEGGEFGPQSMHIVDPDTGAVLETKTGFCGAISLDSLGGVYVHDSAHGHSVSAFGQTVPVEFSSFQID